MQAYGLAEICTIKLHFAVHHVADMMHVHGYLHKFQEMWLERDVGSVKGEVDPKVTDNRELAYVNLLLLKLASQRAR